MKSTLPQELKSTALHALELAACLAAALFIVRYFHLGNDDMSLVVGIALNALSKFARTSEASPIPDFVNEK